MVRRALRAYSVLLQSIADNRLDFWNGLPHGLFTTLSLRMYRQSPFTKLPGRIRILGVTAERSSKSEGVLRFPSLTSFIVRPHIQRFHSSRSPHRQWYARSPLRERRKKGKEAGKRKTETDRECYAAGITRRQSRKTRIKGNFHLGILKILIYFK